MSSESLPILPTSVIGSYAYPGWLLTALEKIGQGEYGETDIREVYDDACRMAILDQERAGIDIVSDGEMRRWYFVQSFPKRMTGLAVEPPLRKTGLYGYDTPTRYRATEKVTLPSGLGIVDEFKFTKANTNKPIKVTCPGPLTMTIHIRPGDCLQKSTGAVLATGGSDQCGIEGLGRGGGPIYPDGRAFLCSRSR